MYGDAWRDDAISKMARYHAKHLFIVAEKWNRNSCDPLIMFGGI